MKVYIVIDIDGLSYDDMLIGVFGTYLGAQECKESYESMVALVDNENRFKIVEEEVK